MNGSEQLAFARRTVLAQLADAPGFVRAMLGRRATGADVELRDPPDTALGRAAREEAAACSAPELLRHCLRCWYLGDLFGRLDRVQPDPELLYVSCLLHDLGLTAAYDPGPIDFATFGAETARAFVGDHGAGRVRADVIAGAIDGHMNMTAPRNQPEAYLLHAAAQCDVAGRRVADVPAAAAARLVELHPRTGLTDVFAHAMRTSGPAAAGYPRGRAVAPRHVAAAAAQPLDR